MNEGLECERLLYCSFIFCTIESQIFGFLNLLFRGRAVAAVQDLMIAEVHGRKLVFVLHSDGTLRVWDLLSGTRILSHTFAGKFYKL